jgi:hypothetical protein
VRADEHPCALVTSVTVANFGDCGPLVNTTVGVAAGGVVSASAENAAMSDGPPPHDFTTHRTKTAHDYYNGIRGTRLRHAALAVLMRVGSCSIAEMWTYLKGRHRLDPAVTKKTVADALRYECAKGRAVSDEYGRYRIGKISPRTRRRIATEEREIGVELGGDEYVEHLLHEEERRLLERVRAEMQQT